MHTDERLKVAVKPILFGGSFAIFEVFTIKCPTESMKTKSMTRTLPHWNAFRIIMHSQGSVLWNGLISVIIKQSVSWISFIGFLDLTCNLLQKYPNKRVPGIPESLQISLIAGILNVVAVCPFDACLTNVQKDGSTLRDIRYFSAIRQIVTTYGYQRLYSGFTVKCVRSVWYSWTFSYLLRGLRNETSSVKYDA